MVSSFGFTVIDHGVALTRCPGCTNLLSVNAAFPDSDWSSLAHLLSVLESYLESQNCQIACGTCKDEVVLGVAGADLEYWLWHAHYLPESRRDLQVLLHRRSGHTLWVEGMLLNDLGEITPLALPMPESDFRCQAGCYFSVRQAWREFMAQNWPISQFAGLEISEGYFLVLNPAINSDADLQTFKEDCVRLVGKSSSSNTQFEFADLSWADTWKFEENTYHQWLGDFEAELKGSELIAGVLASPRQFYKIIETELKPFGCWLRCDGDSPPVAFLGDDEYYLSFDYREFLINAMIKGYSYWGALRFVEPILDSWEQARDVGERLKQLLTSYKCTVYGGHHFQCRAKRGKKIIQEFDLMSLAEADNELEESSEFLSWIAPQISLNPDTLKFEA